MYMSLTRTTHLVLIVILLVETFSSKKIPSKTRRVDKNTTVVCNEILHHNISITCCESSKQLKCLPYFVIAGTQKSGTTALAASHPFIKFPSRKEIHYFDKKQRFQNGINGYLKYFRALNRTQTTSTSYPIVSAEATPFYLASPQACSRMKTIVPNAKLIILMREPVARAYSEYQMKKRRVERQQKFISLVEMHINAVHRCLVDNRDNWTTTEKCLPDKITKHPEWLKFVSVGKKLISESAGGWSSLLGACFDRFPEEVVGESSHRNRGIDLGSHEIPITNSLQVEGCLISPLNISQAKHRCGCIRPSAESILSPDVTTSTIAIDRIDLNSLSHPRHQIELQEAMSHYITSGSPSADLDEYGITNSKYHKDNLQSNDYIISQANSNTANNILELPWKNSYELASNKSSRLTRSRPHSYNSNAKRRFYEPNNVGCNSNSNSDSSTSSSSRLYFHPRSCFGPTKYEQLQPLEQIMKNDMEEIRKCYRNSSSSDDRNNSTKDTNHCNFELISDLLYKCIKVKAGISGQYVYRSLYSPQLRNCFKSFPRHQFLLLTSERLRKDPTSVLSEVLRFLHLPVDQLPLINNNSNNGGVNIGSIDQDDSNSSATLTSIISPHHGGSSSETETSSSSSSTSSLPSEYAEIQLAVEKYFPHFEQATGWRLTGDYDAIPTSLRNALREFFAPFNEDLFALVGQRFEEWDEVIL